MSKIKGFEFGLNLKASRKIVLCAAVLPLLASCGTPMNFQLATAGIAAAANDFFKRTDVNLLEKNYAAADYMATPMKEYIDRTDLIAVRPLMQTDNVEITSPLGLKVSEDIGLRFMQLGFTVALNEVASGANAGLYAAPKSSPAFIFGGHYLRGRDNLDVHLRVTDAKTGQVVSAFDYAVPVTREIEELSNTPPRIFKIEPAY